MPPITLYRLRDPRLQFTDYVSEGGPDRSDALPGFSGVEAALWRRREPVPVPDWSVFVTGAFSGEAFVTEGERESALLILRITRSSGTTAWAAALGPSARFWLKQEMLDADAPIIASLRAFRDDATGGITGLKGISVSEISANPQRVQRDTSRETTLYELTFDGQGQSLGRLRGTSQIKGLAGGVEGGQSLRLHKIKDVPDLVRAIGVVDDILAAVAGTPDAVVPGLRGVGEPLRSVLDGLLAEAVRAGDSSIVLAVPPEAADRRVYFTKLGATDVAADHRVSGIMDPSLDEYLALVKKTVGLAALTADFLKHVQMKESVPDASATWSLWRSLSGITMYQGEAFVIDEGRWYKIGADLLEQLNLDVDNCKELGRPLIAFAHADEGAYNAALAKDLGANAINLDAQIIRGQGYTSGIEMADVLNVVDEGGPIVELFHNKRHFRATGLNHMFGQGSAAAQSLLDTSVRTALLDRIDASGLSAQRKADAHEILRADRPFNPARVRIVFGIIGNWRGMPASRAVPVLARTVFRRTLKSIRSFTYDVRIAKIAVNPAPAKKAVSGRPKKSTGKRKHVRR